MDECNWMLISFCDFKFKFQILSEIDTLIPDVTEIIEDLRYTWPVKQYDIIELYYNDLVSKEKHFEILFFVHCIVVM